jgi:ParB family chromosome partitioning protein
MTRTAVANVAPEPQYSKQTDSVTELSLSSISANPHQPRTIFEDDSLKELAASISSVGILQPLIVRKVSDTGYQIVAGERRFRAAKIAKLKTVPVIVRNSTPLQTLELALIENLQREDITAIECARTYRRLVDEHDLTQDEVADCVGKSRAAIANTMRLVRLPDEIQEALEQRIVSEGQVRPLLSLKNSNEQLHLFEKILIHGLNARQVESIVQGAQSAIEPSAKKAVSKDPNWSALESSLSQYIGFNVALNKGKKGGSLVLKFGSDEELQSIFERIGFEMS